MSKKNDSGKYKNLEGVALPRHVAIIMDGNGRWAKKRMLPRSLGHRAGVEALRGVITMSSDIGIEVLTLYAFSTENWARPQDEVGVLMDLLVEFLNKEIAELHENEVNIRFMGDVDKFPERCKAAIENAIELTRNNKGLIVNIALNYGGRHELVRALKSILEEAGKGSIDKASIDEGTISDVLYTAGLPDPDLLIRTSGEMRLSNFMLYQSSYSELYIPDTLWPDFDEAEYEKALLEYSKRKRRYGKI
jgi:undecaprenyl diphosphate synthase